MPGTGQGTPISLPGSGMNRGELKKYTRFLLSKYDQAALSDKHLLHFSLEDALLDGYRRVAMELKSLRADYTRSTVIDTDLYQLSSWGGGAGARIFQVISLFYDGLPLYPVTVARLDRMDSRWRFRASGGPRYFIPWSQGVIRIYPKPSAARDLYIEGWEIPDAGELDSDDDIPRIMAADQPLISIWAAILYSVGTPDENSLRTSALFPLWTNGLREAKERAHKSGPIIVGRDAESGSGGFLPPMDSIDNYTL